jgi:four helix bundle protein
MTYSSFEDLEVWKKARELAKKVYAINREGTFSKDFKLRDQINASAGSIMDNIAEGFEREGQREFIQFLSIAKGSAGEVRSQLYRALDREHISREVFEALQGEAVALSKQLSGFIRYLKSSDYRGTKYVKEPGENYGND